MRKILGNPALEAELAAQAAAQEEEAKEAERLVALESISLEEQQALLDEANQSAEEASADLQEVERVTEVSDALEDLAVIAGEIKEPTEGEVALMGNAAQMAVAGTDVAPDEVVPAMESIDDWKARGNEFALTVKAKAKQIWEKIMAFLRKIWGQIQEFFFRIFDTIPRLQKVLNDQLKALGVAKTQNRNSAGKPIKMNVGFSALIVSGRPAMDADELKLGFSSLSNYCDYVFGKYVGAVKSRGEAVAKEIGDFKWEAALHAAEAVAQANLRHKLPAPDIDNRTTAVQGDYQVSVTKGTLGGLVLTHKAASDAAMANANALRKLELLRGEGLEVSRGSAGQYGAGAAYEIMPLAVDTAVGLIKEAQDVLKRLEGWKKTGLKQMQDVQKKLEAASNKAAGVFGSGVGSFTAGTEAAKAPKDIDVALYRGALNFNTAFTRWMSEPTVALTRGSLASCRALAILVDKSLATYVDTAAIAA